MYSRYHSQLSVIPELTMIETDLEETAPWFIDVLVDESTRENLITHLAEDGIGSRTFHPAIHTQEPYASDGSWDFPISSEISARGLWLPSSSQLTDEEIDRVCESISMFFRS